MNASPDFSENCHLWIIILWMVVAVGLPFADFNIPKPRAYDFSFWTCIPVLVLCISQLAHFGSLEVVGTLSFWFPIGSDYEIMFPDL
jgi:hypothetical protein